MRPIHKSLRTPQCLSGSPENLFTRPVAVTRLSPARGSQTRHRLQGFPQSLFGTLDGLQSAGFEPCQHCSPGGVLLSMSSFWMIVRHSQLPGDTRVLSLLTAAPQGHACCFPRAGVATRPCVVPPLAGEEVSHQPWNDFVGECCGRGSE